MYFTWYKVILNFMVVTNLIKILKLMVVIKKEQHKQDTSAGTCKYS